MQHKSRNCLFGIIVSFIIICCGSTVQAETTGTPAKSTATQAGTTATKSTAASSSPAATKSPSTATAKVATVNGTTISQEKFDTALSYQKEIYTLNGVTISDDQLPELKYQLLESLIGNELLFQDSQKNGITVDEKEINESYETQKKKAKFTTDAEFEAALKQSNKTLASFKAEIKQGLAINHLIEKKFSNSTAVSDSEAKKYYDAYPSYFEQTAKVRASHIVILVGSDADQAKKDDARKKIEQVKTRLKAGEDFAAVAKDVSDDTGTKADGGDLGYFSKGQMKQAIEDAAFALKKGETSDIVTTDVGYHVIKVTDKTDAKKLTFEEAKNDIITNLKSTKVNSAVNKYITVLRNKATVVTYPISK